MGSLDELKVTVREGEKTPVHDFILFQWALHCTN